MNKLSLILAILLSVVFFQSYSQSYKGVIYKLTVDKYKIENITSKILNDPKVDQEIKDKITARYLTLKSKHDASVNQFIYEMNRRNCLARKFNQINKHFIKETRSTATYKKAQISTFAREINEHITECNSYYLFCKNETGFIKDKPTKDSLEKLFTAGTLEALDPLAIIELGWTIFTDIKEMQGKKVEFLSNLLNELKLANPKEFVKEK